MDNFRHNFLDINGVRLHTAEAGEGPLVVLLHGFPELWYSWRHQLAFLAERGYHAVAIDQRGYGRSSKFWSPDAYRIGALVDDVVGLIEHLDEGPAVVVGHDWGAPVAWSAAWLHPENFRGVMGMSVPFSGRALVALPGNPFGEHRPEQFHAELAGPGHDFYQTYFGTLGPIVDEIEADLAGWVRDLMYGVSGEGMAEAGFDPTMPCTAEAIRQSAVVIPHGRRMRERFVSPRNFPTWLSEDDLQVFVSEFERTGLAGGLNYYRNIDQSWQDLEPHANRKLEVPSFFLGAEYDIATWWGQEAIARVEERCSDYRGTVILEGSGHWLQQERPAETNAVLEQFLKEVHG
jgi:pimeloyl-ACP methyl ester carboxylesterase